MAAPPTAVARSLLPLLAALRIHGQGHEHAAAGVGRVTSYDISGDFDQARHSFAANSTLNVLEAWVAPYDEGTARYRLRARPRAPSPRSEDALQRAPRGRAVPGPHQPRTRAGAGR